MAKYSEGFEGGTLGGTVTSSNTSFWIVEYDHRWPEDTLVRFTDDAYTGGLAATIPPDVLIAAGENEVFQDMVWIGSSPDGKIIDEPVEIEFYYKFESGLEPYFGRFVFEAWFDVIGADILVNQGTAEDPWYYPDTAYQTNLFVGLEHSNEDPGDDPDGMYYYYDNILDAYPHLAPGMETITPQFPRSTWIKCNFAWQGAGLPFTMKAVVVDTGAVLMDVTKTAPAGIGLSHWALNSIGMHYDPADWEGAEGYNFQNWFDGAAVVLQIAGQEGGTRRRFT